MSIYSDALATVKATLEALDSFAGDPTPTIPVVIRKRLFFSAEHGDTYPFCCLARDKDPITALQFNKGAFVDYPIYVVIFQQLGFTIGDLAQQEWQDDRRQEIFSALYKTRLVGFDVNYDPEPVFDLAGLDKLHDISIQKFTYRVSESRP
jgi:hypothetical protein